MPYKDKRQLTTKEATAVLSIVQRIAKARYELDTAANELEAELGQGFEITVGSQDLDGENWRDITPADVIEWVASLDVEF